MGDRGIAMHQGEDDRDGDRRSEAEPDRAGDGGHRAGGEGGAQHLALEADIDDAGALAEESTERREDQRRRLAQRRREQRYGLDEEVVAHDGTAASWAAGASRRASGRRKRFSS